MADNFSKWLGGDNFVKAQQWGVGRTNDGNGKKKFGNAGMRKRVRFNPNPTACNHAGCQVAIRSTADKQKYIESRKK